MDHQNQEGAFGDNFFQWQGNNRQNISAPRKAWKKQGESHCQKCHKKRITEAIKRRTKDRGQCQSRRGK